MRQFALMGAEPTLDRDVPASLVVVTVKVLSAAALNAKS
jgi:hypothetical protein